MMTTESPLQSCPCRFLVSVTTSRRLRLSVQVISKESYISWKNQGKPDDIVQDTVKITPGTRYMEKTVRSNGTWVLVVHATKAAVIEISVRNSLPKCQLRLEFSKSVNESSVPPLALTEHIINGFPLSDGLGDYTVMLRYGPQTCSGSIVGSRWVLTVAHCIIAPGAAVIIGNGMVHRTVAHVHRHPDFRRTSAGMVADIALVQLDALVRTTHIAVHDDLKRSLGRRYARQTGFGRHNSSLASDQRLRAVDIPILNIPECRRRFEEKGYQLIPRALDEHSQLCTDARECGVGSCAGDSGGPLVIVGNGAPIVQAGVLSFSVGGCGALPDVYTRTAYYSEWIKRTSRGEVRFADA